MKSTSIAVLLVASTLLAQGPGRGRPPGPGVVKPASGERIAWFATLAGARAEAKRTGRPILFVSAAPHCHYTPGIW
ncbi:MAG: hypothetical protein OER88_12110 [Planctomycetota bacterium]|nr:hypothetical protein [Planctomycetota bacterium]